MEPIEWYKNAAEIVSAIVAGGALLTAGVWALWRFQIQAEKHSHIETIAEIELIGVQGDYHIVELRAVLVNKSKVEHKIEKFGFDLNAIFAPDPVETDDRWGGQVNFPHEIATGSFLPKHYAYFSIGPGVTARYSFVASVPLEARFLLLHCWFDYANRPGMTHSMERTLALAPRSKAD